MLTLSMEDDAQAVSSTYVVDVTGHEVEDEVEAEDAHRGNIKDAEAQVVVPDLKTDTQGDSDGLKE